MNSYLSKTVWNFKSISNSQTEGGHSENNAKKRLLKKLCNQLIFLKY